MKHIFLGRFAPFHEGHKILLTKLISKFESDNCMVIIGSSNIIDTRTPYSPIEREEMIRKVFPKIEIRYLMDIGNDDKWLEILKNLENKMNEEFVFYGGSKKDLKVLNQKFKTVVLVDRKTEGKGISGTETRKSYSL